MWTRLFLLVTFPSVSLGLLCHSCVVKAPPRAPGTPISTPALCSQFDGSERFVVNCSQSTFCQTRTYRFYHKQRTGRGEVVIVERGCAQQSYQHQALVRGKWRTVTTVLEEVYTSGCLTDREWAGPLSSDTEYCYCKEDKCNSQLQEGDLNTAVASNGTDFNSASTSASSKSYPELDSLPHPRNTRLFYKVSKSGSPDILPVEGLLLSSYFLAKVL